MFKSVRNTFLYNEGGCNPLFHLCTHFTRDDVNDRQHVAMSQGVSGRLPELVKPTRLMKKKLIVRDLEDTPILSPLTNSLLVTILSCWVVVESNRLWIFAANNHCCTPSTLLIYTCKVTNKIYYMSLIIFRKYYYGFLIT